MHSLYVQGKLELLEPVHVIEQLMILWESIYPLRQTWPCIQWIHLLRYGCRRLVSV